MPKSTEIGTETEKHFSVVVFIPHNFKYSAGQCDSVITKKSFLSTPKYKLVQGEHSKLASLIFVTCCSFV